MSVTDLDVYKISSNLINGDLVTFPYKSIYYLNSVGTTLIQPDTQTIYSDTHWLNKEKRPINGNYSFQLSTINNTGINNVTLEFGLAFEFIKF